VAGPAGSEFRPGLLTQSARQAGKYRTLGTLANSSRLDVGTRPDAVDKAMRPSAGA
jgi:hypothetical protein